MDLTAYMEANLPQIEDSLQLFMRQSIPAEYPQLYEMLAYHLGWEGEGAGEKARGKRVRPLLVLLAAQTCGGSTIIAMPGALAVEILHNFSLIHDDIEDNSLTRRGRPTVWAKWGLPQALNSGDLMFSLAYAALLGKPNRGAGAADALSALRLLQSTIQQLVQGQHLDMAFESRAVVRPEEYWQMIDGKTAALLSCCCEMGALLAGADPSGVQKLGQYGRSLGMAFQVVDDWLGIWGDAAVTGKGVGDDLLVRKKTLPILYGLAHSEVFHQRWQEPFCADDLPWLSQLLIDCGARHHCETLARELTDQALGALEEVPGACQLYKDMLRDLAIRMTRRDK